MNSKGTLIREYRGAVDNLNKIQTTATDYMTSKTRDADDFDTKPVNLAGLLIKMEALLAS